MAAFIFGFLQALPSFGLSVQPSSLTAAARGLASSEGILGSPSLQDRFASWLWKTGGDSWLMAGEALARFAIGAVIAALVLALALAILHFLPRKRLRLLLAGALLLLLVATCLFSLWRGFAARPALTRSPLLTLPAELANAAASLPPSSVFANSSALPFLFLYAPSSIALRDPAAAARLTADPLKWRRELRKSGWSAVLLAGSAGEIQPLLDHLLISPDWRLARISNQGFLFLRDEGAPPPPLDPATFHLPDTTDTAIYLAQIAERYEAIHKTSLAKACISQALEDAPDNPEVLMRAASIEASRRHWQDTLALCERALKADPRLLYARLLKALALLETGRADYAEQEARQVLRSSPGDLYTLFLYARISRAIHDYRTESLTLEKLIAATLSSGTPVPVGYYVFLGQAYAKTGDARNALRAYHSALDHPGIDPSLAAEVRESVQTIEQKKDH